MEYKRLKEKLENILTLPELPFEEDLTAVDCKQMYDIICKIENGTLIELPCKVGDTLYFIYNRPHADKPMIEPKIYETKDWYFDIDGKGVAILPRSIRGYNGEYFYYLQKTVFLTREEAEKKLEELRK